jgi:glyoxylase-like metal-dependent hydrolase (beta-lactamase superfamily II)
MLGDTLRLADNLWFIHGEMPTDASKAPDWCNVVIYLAGDRLYLVDSSGGPVIRAAIGSVLQEIGPVASFTLINTHAHLDHICNNDVIADVRSSEKHHYLLQDGIDAANRGFSTYMADQFDHLDTFFDPFSSYQVNRGLYRVAGLLRDGLGRFAGRQRVLRWLFTTQFTKFDPVRDSRHSMEALDRTPSRPIRIGGSDWNGWTLGGGDVHVLEARAHAAGDVLVYLPEHKMLCMGDVTFRLFPTFMDSSRDGIVDCLRKGLAMASSGDLDVLADGHGDRCYDGRTEIEQLLDRLLSDHLAYEEILTEIFQRDDGLTPAEVYEAFRTYRDRPVVDRYLALEFPHTPPSLQNVLVTSLLHGLPARGPRRPKRFFRTDLLSSAPTS